MSVLEPPRRLSRTDERGDFDSGAPELDDWLRRFALQNQRAGNAITYATVLDGRVVGYYAICAAGIGRDQAPPEFGHHRPAGIPCVLLARLAVDRRAQGRGIGRALVKDAILRSCRVAQSVGAVFLVIHCRDEEAKRFYSGLAEFRESPLDDLQLLLPLAPVVRLLSGLDETRPGRRAE